MLSDRISGSFSLFSPGPPVLLGRKPGVLAKPLPLLKPASLLLTVPRGLPHPLCADAPPLSRFAFGLSCRAPPFSSSFFLPTFQMQSWGVGVFQAVSMPGSQPTRAYKLPAGSEGSLSSLPGTCLLNACVMCLVSSPLFGMVMQHRTIPLLSGPQSAQCTSDLPCFPQNEDCWAGEMGGMKGGRLPGRFHPGVFATSSCLLFGCLL